MLKKKKRIRKLHPITKAPKHFSIVRFLKRWYKIIKRKIRLSYHHSPQKWVWYGLYAYTFLTFVLLWCFFAQPLIALKLDADKYYKNKVDREYALKKAELQEEIERLQLEERVRILEKEKSDLEAIIIVKDLEIKDREETITIREGEIYTMILVTSQLLKSLGGENYFYEKAGKIYFNGDLVTPDTKLPSKRK